MKTKPVDQKFLDGIDLKWGSMEATVEMIDRIAARKGIGVLASKTERVSDNNINQSAYLVE